MDDLAHFHTQRTIVWLLLLVIVVYVVYVVFVVFVVVCVDVHVDFGSA